jgi:serine/threonine protein kinase
MKGGIRGPEDPKDHKVDSTLVRGRVEVAKFHGVESEDTKDPMIGKTLMGRYKLIELIGRGGMGNVYLADDMRMGKKVAVKILPDEFKKSKIAERFVQEALLAPRIDHENIVDVTDRGKTSDGVPFFVMEWLKGSDLGFVITREGAMPWCNRTKDILLQICMGLSAAHEKGIVHRDMKPENVFLVERSDNREFIKLFDFGIAKLLEGAMEDEPVHDAPIAPSGKTQAGTVMGTPQYMAPEQATAGNIDHRVDVYALGVIMFEMLCGRVPFVLEAKDDRMAEAMRVLELQKTAAPPFPRELRADIPQEAEEVIMKALAKNRDERFGTIRDMEAAIARISVPDMAPRPNSGNSLPAINGLRPGSRSMMAYTAVQKEEERRRKMVSRRLLMAFAAAAAIGGAVAGERVYHSGRSWFGTRPQEESLIKHSSDAGSEQDGNTEIHRTGKK